jgi:triosephosphate isomerase
MEERRLTPPIILINFKSYVEGLGEGAVRLAKSAEDVGERLGVTVGVAPQYVDLRRVCAECKIPVFAQHVDVPNPGAYTGSVSVDAVKDCGVAGSLLNHSEKRLRLSDLGLLVSGLRRNRLLSVVCGDTELVSAAGAALNPDMVAIEPPELIGTGRAVSKARPEIVSNTVSLIKRINPNVTVLCGAGITKGEDVESALKLGAEGVLVASGVVKARDQAAAIYELAEAALKAS